MIVILIVKGAGSFSNEIFCYHFHKKNKKRLDGKQKTMAIELLKSTG